MDTVVYKLHGPDKYPIIIKAVQDLQHGKGIAQVPERLIDKTTDSFRKMFFNMDKDCFHLMQYNVRADLPSSATGIQISYDEQREYIKFELSIAKFFFGNNVCELIPGMGSKYFDATDMSMSALAQFWYKILKVVFQKIIRDLTRGLFTDFSWTDVQLSRIDIPFNQLFDTVKELNHYFESEKRVGMERLGDSSQTNYKSAFTFLVDDYYFKVYCKGPEFEKTGRSQIVKHYDDFLKKGLLHDGSAVALSMTEIDWLQSTADRTIRYELEVKSGLMKSLFNQHLKKHKIPEYRELKAHVDYVMREENRLLVPKVVRMYRDDSGTVTAKRLNKFLIYETVYYLPECDLITGSENIGLQEVTNVKLLGRLKRIFNALAILRTRFHLLKFSHVKSVAKFLQKETDIHHQFFFEIEEVDAAKAILPKHDAHYDCDTMGLLDPTPVKQKFSSALLKLCIMKHNQMFQKLQFSSLPGEKDIELLCKEYNDALDNSLDTGKKAQKMRVNQMKLLVMNLKNATWKELKETGHVDRVTVYRWQKKLEKLHSFGKAINYVHGINLENVQRRPSSLYSRHYDEMLQGKNALSVFIQNTPTLLIV